uniref:Uncharacterized protein n=1 Tax=Rhabditophanes sp. KR3021 TaxID=114890 RepID=A0AC35TWN7_9BILA
MCRRSSFVQSYNRYCSNAPEESRKKATVNKLRQKLGERKESANPELVDAEDEEMIDALSKMLRNKINNYKSWICNQQLRLPQPVGENKKLGSSSTLLVEEVSIFFKYLH